VTATLDSPPEGSSPQDSPEAPRPHGAFYRLYYGQTSFDFVRRKRNWFILSTAVILIGMVSLAIRGLNFGIDFDGGTAWQVLAPGVTVKATEAALTPLGLGGSSITILGGKTLSVEAKLAKGHGISSQAEIARVSAVLGRLSHQPASAVSVTSVGPTWGGQITHKAILALIVFFVLIAGYISIFFEWKMAMAAIIAVLHDILVTVGIYALTGFQVTPDTIVAFLTILGYSLYDTIVVFDRIRDNTKGLGAIGATGKLTYSDVVNLSVNQTLARSINTSLVAIMPILAVLVLGAEILGATTLQYFGLALLIGLTSGAYSSIFIASPLVAIFKEHEPRYATIRERLAARGPTEFLLTPAAAAAGAFGGADETTLRRRPSAAKRSGGSASRSGGGSRRPGAPERNSAGRAPARGGRAARDQAPGETLRPGAGQKAAQPQESGLSDTGAAFDHREEAPEELARTEPGGVELSPEAAPAPSAEQPRASGEIALGAPARGGAGPTTRQRSGPPARPTGSKSQATRPPRPRKKGKRR